MGPSLVLRGNAAGTMLKRSLGCWVAEDVFGDVKGVGAPDSIGKDVVEAREENVGNLGVGTWSSVVVMEGWEGGIMDGSGVGSSVDSPMLEEMQDGMPFDADAFPMLGAEGLFVTCGKEKVA